VNEFSWFDEVARALGGPIPRRKVFRYVFGALGAMLFAMEPPRLEAFFECQRSAVPPKWPAAMVCGNRLWCAQTGTFCCVYAGGCLCCDTAAAEQCVMGSCV
jgi:hypothetical protein